MGNAHIGVRIHSFIHANAALLRDFDSGQRRTGVMIRGEAGIRCGNGGLTHLVGQVVQVGKRRDAGAAGVDGV